MRIIDIKISEMWQYLLPTFWQTHVTNNVTGSDYCESCAEHKISSTGHCYSSNPQVIRGGHFRTHTSQHMNNKGVKMRPAGFEPAAPGLGIL